MVRQAKEKLQSNNLTGWMYTLFAFVLCVEGGLLILLIKRGEAWRYAAEVREAEADSKNSEQPSVCLVHAKENA